MQIGRKDVVWNFIATFMRVASGLIVLPLVLRLLPTQEVGLWNIFITIGSIATLLDFGFSSSFLRNITYVFSGVKTLKAKGYHAVENNDTSIDYGLLKSVISAMRRYYGFLAVLFFALFLIASPFYLTSVLQHYTGNKTEVWIAWLTYGALVAYQLYTYYYSSILSGRGYVKRVQQITIISQASRIVSSVVFLLLGFGLISLVIGQLVSDIVNRSMCYSAFYDKEIKTQFKNVTLIPVSEIMKIMTPNALRIGITTLGAFFISKAIILIASLYFNLAEIASYGTTKQMIELIMSLGSIWFATFYPKITLHRVNNEMDDVKRMYIKGNLTLIATFLLCGIGLIFIGPQLLILIHSKTHLLPAIMIVVLLISGFLDSNQNMATSFLLTGNEVPFMKSTIFTGIVSITILYASFYFGSLGYWGLILAPFIAQSVYQNWKWPQVVAAQLNIKPKDYFITFGSIVRDFIPKNK